MRFPRASRSRRPFWKAPRRAGWGSSSLFRLANNPFGIKYFILDRAPRRRVIGSSGQSDGLKSQCADEPMNRSADQPIPDDYGAFDALTWEIENGQKKVIVAQFQRFPNLDEAFTRARVACCAGRATGRPLLCGTTGNSLRSGWDPKPPRWTRSIVVIPQIPATPRSLSSWSTFTGSTIPVPSSGLRRG